EEVAVVPEGEVVNRVVVDRLPEAVEDDQHHRRQEEPAEQENCRPEARVLRQPRTHPSPPRRCRRGGSGKGRLRSGCHAVSDPRRVYAPKTWLNESMYACTFPD